MERTPALHRQRQVDRYPGYPTEHLVLDIAPDCSLQDCEIPDGPWTMNATPLPSPEETRALHSKGYATDSQGRPLHPWAQFLLSAEHGGVATGKGTYWHWGPNPTADPIVMTTEDRPRILLIERGDTGALALPGGFINNGEAPLDAALRELEEETGLRLAQPGKLVYQGPVVDLRGTLHAWAETSAYRFTIDTPCEVEGRDDAVKAQWYFVDELPDVLFGSHASLVAMALSC